MRSPHNDTACTWHATLCGQRGVALLAVLWLVAALSIMVSGMLHAVRSEIRLTGLSRHGVIQKGIADAAIRLILQELVSDRSQPLKFIQTKTISIFDQQVDVQITPVNGLIDINNAPKSLLADVFEYAGGIARDAAQRMAENVILARERKTEQGEAVRFHAPEDLLLLAGLDYDTYARLRPLLTVDIVGSGRVNPLAALAETLLVLTKGDSERARQLIESRHSTPESMDTTQLTANHFQIAATSYLALQATIALADHTRLTRTWRVDMATAAYGLPWTVLGVDTNQVVTSSAPN